jgi:D-alanine--poly(phosphoribitol) ligase subunit 1
MGREYRYNVGLTFAAVAESYGDGAAMRFAHGSVSYAELNSSANRIAAVFGDLGLQRRDVIGIVHTKTLYCYAAMIAALKLGVAYVNLDDQNPAARMKHIFGTARPRFVFGEDVPVDVRVAASEAGAKIVEVSPEFEAAVAQAPAHEPRDVELVTGADPAYLMYTSGSTGVPKGAMMTHGNVLNFGSWVRQRFGIGDADTLTNVNPMYFDNSVFDFYGALLNGAAVAPVPREIVADAPKMLEQIETAGCTIWFSVPSLLIYLTTLKLLTADRLGSVRAFVFGGEGYPKPELRKLYAAFANRAKLINVYGPTECTCICSAWDVRAADLEDPNGLVTLGPVAENFSMAVLDGERAVAPGEVGELCLLGPQVGLGYANDPQRTACSFVPNPGNASWGERMYLTGDLVRLGSDGRMLDFVGRKDNQIKHMGYRIELEEIEAALNQLEGVIQSAVLHRAARREMKMLVAYVSSDRATTEDALRERLASLLPPYMIPQRFQIRSALPKNANGKVDRIALAAEDLE